MARGEVLRFEGLRVLDGDAGEPVALLGSFFFLKATRQNHMHG
jgi:hypothetical protein